MIKATVALSVFICAGSLGPIGGVSRCVAAAPAPATTRSSQPLVDEIIHGVRRRDNRMSNIEITAAETMTYTPGANSRYPAKHYLCDKFTVKRRGSEIAFEGVGYDENGAIIRQGRTAWNGVTYRAASRVALKTQAGADAGTALYGLITDAEPGPTTGGILAFRVHEILGLRVSDGYKETVEKGKKSLIEVPTTLAEYFETAHTRLGERMQAKRVTLDGRKLVELIVPSPYWTGKRETFWIDPERDYMPVRQETFIDGRGGLPNHALHDVVAAGEIDGFWMPLKIVLRFCIQADAAGRGTEEYQLSNVRLGKVSDADFRVGFPVDSTVVDYVGQVAYKVLDKQSVQPVYFAGADGREPILASLGLLRQAIARNPPFAGFDLRRILPAAAPATKPAETSPNVRALAVPADAPPRSSEWLYWTGGGVLIAFGIAVAAHGARRNRGQRDRNPSL
jgi:hypothetical protein